MIPEKTLTISNAYSVPVSDFDLASSSFALNPSRILAGHSLIPLRLKKSASCCVPLLLFRFLLLLLLLLLSVGLESCTCLCLVSRVCGLFCWKFKI